MPTSHAGPAQEAFEALVRGGIIRDSSSGQQLDGGPKLVRLASDAYESIAVYQAAKRSDNSGYFDLLPESRHLAEPLQYPPFFLLASNGRVRDDIRIMPNSTVRHNSELHAKRGKVGFLRHESA
jgi:hypothetical protein